MFERAHKPSERGIAKNKILLIVVIACIALWAFFLSTTSVKTGPTSPHLTGADIVSASELTAASQHVEIRLSFDAPFESKEKRFGNLIIDPTSSALLVNLDGKNTENDKTMKIGYAIDGSDMVVSLSPHSGNAANQFTYGEGVVQIKRHPQPSGSHGRGALNDPNSSIALETITGFDGYAVLFPETVDMIIPSGVIITSMVGYAGSAQTGVPAQVSFTVDQPAQIRCATWIGINGQRVCKDNDNFLEDDTSSTAADLADAIATGFSGTYEAHADGNTVTVRATKVVDGQNLDVHLIEGLQGISNMDSVVDPA